MYYEYLQEMGRQYGMQKRAGISDAGVRAVKAILSDTPKLTDELIEYTGTVPKDVGLLTRLFGGKKLLAAANKHRTALNKYNSAYSDSVVSGALAENPDFRVYSAKLKAHADAAAYKARLMAMDEKEALREYGDALDSARRRMTITAGGLGAGGLASLPLALSEKSASMRKQAGDVDTWGGNAVSALVPFGTIDKVNDRGEGVGGFLTRNTMHGVGSGLGVGAGLLPFVPSVNREIDKAVAAGLSPADIATKAPKLRKLMLGAMLSGTALGVGGAVVGDRVADKML